MRQPLWTCSRNFLRPSPSSIAEPPPVGGQTGATTEPIVRPRDGTLSARALSSSSVASMLTCGRNRNEVDAEQSLRERERLIQEAEDLNDGRPACCARPSGDGCGRWPRHAVKDATRPRPGWRIGRNCCGSWSIGCIWEWSDRGSVDRIEVEWHTGADQGDVPRPLARCAWAPKTSEIAVERIRELLPTCDYVKIAEALNAEGLRTAKGLEFDVYSVGYVARSRGWGGQRQSKRSAMCNSPCLISWRPSSRGGGGRWCPGGRRRRPGHTATC